LNNPKFDIKSCSFGNHLFNLEKGFLLIRLHNPEKELDQSTNDKFYCLNCVHLMAKFKGKMEYNTVNL
jgi:hypothetical protein